MATEQPHWTGPLPLPLPPAHPHRVARSGPEPDHPLAELPQPLGLCLILTLGAGRSGHDVIPVGRELKIAPTIGGGSDAEHDARGALLDGACESDQSGPLEQSIEHPLHEEAAEHARLPAKASLRDKTRRKRAGGDAAAA
eukprot:scaffold77_cov116-Isochrysis_galbana.AAC.2